MLLLILLAGSANAQEIMAQVQVACAPHDYMLAKARNDWHESGALQSPASKGKQFMELLVSPGNTWTVIITRADDMSCIMAEGEGLMLSSEIPLLGEGM